MTENDDITLMDGYDYFESQWSEPFLERHSDDMPDGTDILVHFLSFEVFKWDGWQFPPVIKDRLFAELISEEWSKRVQDPKGGVVLTLETAETCLAYLVQTEMVCVDGALITIHPRFPPLITRPDGLRDYDSGDYDPDE